jgi:2-amino-4-hydroxy-6-hydroxymethyldihydropteridine diphosphokinase
VSRAVLAYVGLGSNLGDRVDAIVRAIRGLKAAPGVQILRQSALYETAPWGLLEQPWYLNAVAELTTTLGPTQLLLLLKKIESDLGRTSTYRWGPREIDLDLLLYGATRLARPGLIIPHRELENRAFVLGPLAELRPDLELASGRPISARLTELGATQSIVRLADSSLVWTMG